LALTATASAADWPTFRHDNTRSARSSESLPAAELGLAWLWQSAEPPQPAWAGPAKWDAYNDIPRLNSMRNYDAAPHVAVAGEQLYFGSSLDDTVRCLDARSGVERWRFTTEGPVRIAPAVSDDKVYFGSDDGTAYCLNADTGAVVWKFNLRADYRRVINNGRLISFWPVRTGVTVQDGTAYFCASMLPWRRSYLCAVDAETGKVEGEGRFVKELSESNSFEGALLASRELLIIPQGRIAPLILNRKDGSKRGKVDYHGSGCFALLTPDNQLFHGPGNRDGNFTASNATTGARLATFPMGQALIVAGDTAYLLSTPTKNAINPEQKENLNIAITADKKPLITTPVDRRTLGRPVITAFDRETKQIRWRQQGLSAVSMILAGDVIYAGLVDGVAALSSKDGSLLWRAPVEGRAFGLAVAAGGLFVSTDEGGIYCFRPGAEAKYQNTRPKMENLKLAEGEAEPVAFSWGPLLQFDGPNSAVVRWGTQSAVPTRLEYLSTSGKREFVETAAKHEHSARLEDLGYKRNHRYAILEPDGVGGFRRSRFDCDTFFNYSKPESTATEQKGVVGEAETTAERAAEKIVARSGGGRGLCVILGAGPLAGELARASELKILCLETDREKIAALRRQLQDQALYGSRVAVLRVDSLEQLPLPSHFANLVVSDRGLTGEQPGGRAAEAFRLLRPQQGLGLFGQPPGVEPALPAELLENYFEQDGIEADIVSDETGIWAEFRKPRLAGAGEWSHQYGRADNSAFGGELLGYTSVANEFETQWVGRPGPRYQPDRNGRKPGPLSTSGRLFAQGLERIVALDGYNGTILWSAEIPELRRFNIPRDSSNWCADRDSVFVAVKDRCWRFDAQRGDLIQQYTLPAGRSPSRPEEWSYLASAGDLLLGSATGEGGSFTEFRGHAAWYDQPTGPETFKVCSDRLFALDKETGKKQWQYQNGLIINSTLSVGGGRVYFVACRNKDLEASAAGRIGSPGLWKDQFLVALDLKTGKPIWEEAIDTDDGLSVFYLAYQREKLVIVSSGEKMYHVSVYDANDGKLAWEDRFDWPGGAHDHGKAMSRPAMIDGNLFVRPRVYDLASGRTLAKVMPGGGCGTYACAGNFLIFRAGNITLWDYRYEIPSQWARLRPGCWLSAIPAAGMLLAPEAGGGCSCGTWMETSVGFMPKGAKPAEVEAKR
jgi:outer membrane protein assembly factor BamB